MSWRGRTCRFRVRSEGRVLLDDCRAGLRRDARSEGSRRRIGEVFGEAFEKLLVRVGGCRVALGELEPLAHGFVGSPATARGARRSFIFVNRRLVRDRAVLATFYRAVRDEWRSDEFPALFLFIELLPEDVDVNVHPAESRGPLSRSAPDGSARGAAAPGVGTARGEEAAPLRTTSLLPSAPFAWEGVGEPELLRAQGGFHERSSRGADSRSHLRSGRRCHLAELSLRPLDPARRCRSPAAAASFAASACWGSTRGR